MPDFLYTQHTQIILKEIYESFVSGPQVSPTRTTPLEAGWATTLQTENTCLHFIS